MESVLNLKYGLPFLPQLLYMLMVSVGEVAMALIVSSPDVSRECVLFVLM